MKSIKVLGIGSPFGDDQLGWEAIDLLLADKKIQSYSKHHLHLEKYDRPGLNLLVEMQDAEFIFLIDAVKSNNPIGKIYRWQNMEIEQLEHFISSHQIGIGETLRLGRILNQLPECIVFYGVEMGNNISAFDVSMVVKKSLSTLIKMMGEEICGLP